MFDRLGQDLRFAFRQLVRHAGPSALLVLTIAVAIGANVAIFSVLEGVVLRPLPYPDADRLLAVWETPEPDRWHQPFTGPDYLDVRSRAETLEEFGLAHLRWSNLSGGGEPARVRTGAGTASLFRLLGVRPELGRLFTEEAELEGGPAVALLSHGLWEERFGADPDAVGRRVLLNGEPVEIVGVMPAAFRFPTPWGGRDLTRLFVPLVLPRDGSTRGSHSYGAYGRVAAGVTPAQVEAELDAIASGLAEAYPETNARTRMWTEPLMARTLGGIRSVLAFLLVIVGLVLVVACANVASMLLARGMNRAGEFAVRASMGAGRRRLVRQLLTESLLLAAVAGLAGILLAWVGVEVLKSLIPESVPRAAHIGVNLKVLAFAGLVTTTAGVLVGLLPAWYAARTDLADVIKHGRAARGGRGRTRLLSGLVTAQLATGFVLVNAALVLAVSYGNVVRQPHNFETERVLVTSISLEGPDYAEPHQRRAFWEGLVRRVRATPGIAAAGVTSKLPLVGGTNGSVLVRDQEFDPEASRPLVEHSFVDAGYLPAMGIPLLAGRTFTQRDMDEAVVQAGRDSARVELPVLVNRAMADESWPDADPLGQVVRPDAAEPRWRARVVGVVANVRQWGPEREALPEIYFPHTAEVWGPIWGQLVVRSAADPEPLAAAIRAAVHELDPTMPTAVPVTMGHILRSSTAGRRFSMLLVSLFAATALLLVVAGTYGVTSYGVARRTHEIGVRMALGAREAGVMRLFLARAAVWVVAGLTIGTAGAWAGTRLTGSMVYGIRPLSPLLMTAGALVMVSVAVAATAFPVRRASAVDPVEALRTE